MRHAKFASKGALFLATLARPDCGQTGIYHRSSVAEDGSWREPVTTAPYKLGEWKRAQYLELLKNERYAMVYRHEPGRATRILSQPGLRQLTLTSLHAFNAVAGGIGNKLTLQAVRRAAAG